MFFKRIDESRDEIAARACALARKPGVKYFLANVREGRVLGPGIFVPPTTTVLTARVRVPVGRVNGTVEMWVVRLHVPGTILAVIPTDWAKDALIAQRDENNRPLAAAV
jgi:hypothetical protein